MKNITRLALLVSVWGTSMAQSSFVADSLDAYIEQGLKDWQVPGLAIAIVKDGKVVACKGYGVTNISTGAKVDANTLFFIASNTKLFTGTALANLAYQNKINLNDKISKYYPEYKLYDKQSTALVTIKDMLTHRIGTKTFQGDFTFWNTTLSRNEIMRRMQYLKPSTNFRDSYGYCNSCFLTAGQVIPKVTNLSWEAYITNELITPLDMKSTTAVGNDIASRVSNIAIPYTTSFTNVLQPVPYDEWDNLGPAASIVSNVTDMAHWLQFQLDSGKYNGKQVMPWQVLQATRDMHISTGSRKSSWLPVHFRGYGLGVFMADYNGKQIYWHTGGAAGMVSNVCFVPESNLGIVILTNNDNQSFFEALRYQLLDSYLNVPYTNRSKAQLTSFNDDMAEQVKQVNDWKNEVQIEMGKYGAVRKEMAQYAGTYYNQLYGTIRIKNLANYLLITFSNHPNLTATLKPLSITDWLLEYSNIEYGIFKTQFGTKKIYGKKYGTINKLTISIKANDFVEFDPYEFIKL